MKLILLLLAIIPLWAADDVPDWVRQASSQPSPPYSPKVVTASLLREENVTVDADGRWVMRERGVLKVLQKSTDPLIAERSYNTKTGRIRDFRGWLIAPTGAISPLGKEKVADIALSPNETYDEGRAKILSAGTGLAPGSVFAYEVTEEEKNVYTQYGYSFQDSSPVQLSRFSITVPPSGEVRGTMFNHDPVQPAVSGDTYTWELKGLPWIEDERFSPNVDAVVPRIGVSYLPRDVRNGVRGLPDWHAVSAWVSEFVDPAAALSDDIRAKASELTRGAASESDKIHAIARYAQQVNYVSVQLNETRGGGYTPHRATQVLAHNYGDCKDKATLMRALLDAAGIPSYLITIYSGDRTFVRPEWPSPFQFNHAIVAVRVSAETNFPTVLQHPKLGRLLIFDPTDSDTPLGDLPRDEQGSHALVVAGAQGDLLQMPLLPASASRVESTAEASMELNGTLQVHVARQYFGQSAAAAHARVVHQTNDELKRYYERGLGRQVGAISVKQASISGAIGDGRMQLSLDFAAERFAQNMSGLLIVKPGVLALGSGYAFAAGDRKLPVRLDANVYKDTVRIKIPAGFKVDEMPDSLRLEGHYGSYQATWKADGDAVVFEQSTEVPDAIVPAAQYAELRSFFDKIGGSEVAPVVLVRK